MFKNDKTKPYKIQKAVNYSVEKAMQNNFDSMQRRKGAI